MSMSHALDAEERREARLDRPRVLDPGTLRRMRHAIEDGVVEGDFRARFGCSTDEARRRARLIRETLPPAGNGVGFAREIAQRLRAIEFDRALKLLPARPEALVLAGLYETPTAARQALRCMEREGKARREGFVYHRVTS